MKEFLNIKNQFVTSDWSGLFDREVEREYWGKLVRLVENAYTTCSCFPPPSLLFQAFLRTPCQEVKVVILGQDPYHQKGQAHGLSFSVPHEVGTPPSLRNIFKELQRDPATEPPVSNDLSGWASQGVLLLNTWLSVEEGQPGSHRLLGWEHLTDATLKWVSDEVSNVVFMLWGSAAQGKIPLIDANKHLILTAPHPSPLSAHRGFIGCGHFSLANRWLQTKGRAPIDWSNGLALWPNNQ